MIILAPRVLRGGVSTRRLPQLPHRMIAVITALSARVGHARHANRHSWRANRGARPAFSEIVA